MVSFIVVLSYDFLNCVENKKLLVASVFMKQFLWPVHFGFNHTVHILVLYTFIYGPAFSLLVPDTVGVPVKDW